MLRISKITQKRKKIFFYSSFLILTWIALTDIYLGWSNFLLAADNFEVFSSHKKTNNLWLKFLRSSNLQLKSFRRLSSDISVIFKSFEISKKTAAVMSEGLFLDILELRRLMWRRYKARLQPLPSTFSNNKIKKRNYLY